MIHATADQIKEITVADPVLLRALHDFLDAVAGDVDAGIDVIIEELPATIARFSPYADETELSEIVRREMSAALFRLTLRVMPAKGSA
jgi:hypothetical protein